MGMGTIKLIAIIFGATGFWKAIEILLKSRIEWMYRKAESRNLYTQANTQIIENWMQWANKMEKQVEDLKAKNASLNQLILQQQKKIIQLEKKIIQLEKLIAQKSIIESKK